ncbi:MAG: hypothetical protein ACI9KE_003421 [Polyangiales bacterium]|jgi:hypothetical protein
MIRLPHVLVAFALVACSDETPPPVEAIAPGTPTLGTPSVAEPATPGIDPALLVIFREKVGEHRAEMSRIAEDPDLTPAELSAYAASIGRPLPAEIDPAEIPNMQRMIGGMLRGSPSVEQMLPLVIRTEGQRALFVYRQDDVPPPRLILGATLFERDGSDWHLLRTFTSAGEIPAGMTEEEAAHARLDEPDFSEFYSPRELPPLALEAGSLASDLQLWTRSTSSRQCDVSIGGVAVLHDVSSDQTMLLLGREFGSRSPLAGSPLASHFALQATNEITLTCRGASTTPVELRLTRRGEPLPSIVLVLDPASGGEVSGSFDLADPARGEPAVPTFVTNGSTHTSGFVLVRGTRGVGVNVSVEGEGGSATSSTGAPVDLSFGGLGGGTHAGTVTLAGLRGDTDTRVQIAVVAPGVSRVWTVPIAATAREVITFEIEVEGEADESGPPLNRPAGFGMAADY